MSKEEYISELRARIAHLPREEREAAMSYYVEYLEDAGDKSMEEIIAELGTPQQVAERIIADYVQSSRGSGEGQVSKGCLVGLVAVLSSPLWFPLLIAVGAVVFALLLTVLVLLIVFGIVGIFLVGLGIWAIFLHAATGLNMIGGGLILLALMMLMVSLFAAMGSGARTLWNILRRRRSV